MCIVQIGELVAQLSDEAKAIFDSYYFDTNVES